MENNKTVSKNNGNQSGEKCSECKHRRIVVPIVILILLGGVFCAGLAVGHRFGFNGERGEFGYAQKNGGCFGSGRGFGGGNNLNGQGYFNRNMMNGGGFRQPANGLNDFGNATSTSQGVNATSSVSQ
ncbi:MAG: hypothetical protein NT091_04690 [Candidatus Falkowbacteria bacterium]|nr:hypothetical protein [Candidatus Falkowbacteria bacterium]